MRLAKNDRPRTTASPLNAPPMIASSVAAVRGSKTAVHLNDAGFTAPSMRVARRIASSAALLDVEFAGRAARARESPARLVVATVVRDRLDRDVGAGPRVVERACRSSTRWPPRRRSPSSSPNRPDGCACRAAHAGARVRSPWRSSRRRGVVRTDVVGQQSARRARRRRDARRRRTRLRRRSVALSRASAARRRWPPRRAIPPRRCRRGRRPAQSSKHPDANARWTSHVVSSSISPW